MKGTIIRCMEELINETYGAAKWEESLRTAGIPDWRTFPAFGDVDEAEFRAIMAGIVQVLSMPEKDLMDAFGEYWSTVYGPKVYSAYFSQAKTARELLMNLDHIHDVMTKSVKHARPPRFRYEWKSDKHLIMHYNSKRGLVALMPGLIRGVGKHYREKLTVKLVGSAVHVQFP